MNEFLTHVQQLPYSTAECDIGPIIDFKPGKLSVRYDNETDSGRVWTTVFFLGAVASKITPAVAATVMHIDAYSRVCVVENSRWLHELKSRVKHIEGIFENLRHFVLYFDHECAVEVLAQSLQVSEANDSQQD